MHRVLFARIGRLDDDADGLLVETFEAAFALQVFQVTSDRPFARELLRLLVGEETLVSSLVIRSGRTTQRSPWVKACLRKGKSENGAIVLIWAAASCSRRSA